MLNPSAAGGETDDAAIRLCMGRALRMGYGGIIVVNFSPIGRPRSTTWNVPADQFGHDNEMKPAT